MQHTLGMLHFQELIKVVCCAKHAHNLLGVDDKIEESSRLKRSSYRNRGCCKQEICTLNLLNTEDQ